MSYFPWILLGSALAGCAAGGAVLYHSTDGNGQPWKLVRCFAGFVCSMVWIAAIADEVVGVLQVRLRAQSGSLCAEAGQAVGEILGLSDAIIGLTSG